MLRRIADLVFGQANQLRHDWRVPELRSSGVADNRPLKMTGRPHMVLERFDAT